MGKKNINKTPAPGRSGGAGHLVDQTPSVIDEPAVTPASQAKGEALRTVEEAVAQTQPPSKLSTGRKSALSANRNAAEGSRKTAESRAPAFTQDEVALRAYFIAEKRRALGSPGDEHQDWIEAEQQLLGERRQGKNRR